MYPGSNESMIGTVATFVASQLIQSLIVEAGVAFLSGLTESSKLEAGRYISQVSLSSGRLRLHIPSIKNTPELAEKIASAISDHYGVQTVKANPVTGKVLINYDECAISPVMIELIAYLALTSSSSSVSVSMPSAEPLQQAPDFANSRQREEVMYYQR